MLHLALGRLNHEKECSLTKLDNAILLEHVGTCGYNQSVSDKFFQSFKKI